MIINLILLSYGVLHQNIIRWGIYQCQFNFLSAFSVDEFDFGSEMNLSAFSVYVLDEPTSVNFHVLVI